MHSKVGDGGLKQMDQRGDTPVFRAYRVIGDNTGRREEFRIRTVLSDEDRGRMVYKQAASEQAIKFLDTILHRERSTAEYVGNSFDVLMGELDGSAVRYDYVPYLSVQQHIGNYFVNSRPDDANAIFAAYVQKMRALKRIRVCPSEFMTTIAGEGAWNQPLDCLEHGLVDLVPRNTLVAPRRWLLLDNEWSFDFPVPIDFIIFRAIRELAMTLQQPIRSAACSTNRVVSLFAGGSNAYYVPVVWLSYLGTDLGLNRMLRWEAGFQHYVTGQNISVGRIRLFKRSRIDFTEIELHPNSNGLRVIMSRMPGLRQGMRAVERRLLHLRN